MKIRKSTLKDLDTIMSIYARARKFMANIGTFCINWAFEQSGHLRMDTHNSNIPMNNLLKKLGFKYMGIVHVIEDNHPRNAYEKI